MLAGLLIKEEPSSFSNGHKGPPGSDNTVLGEDVPGDLDADLVLLLLVAH